MNCKAFMNFRLQMRFFARDPRAMKFFRYDFSYSRDIMMQ